MRILVVEDEERLARLLVRGLRDEGHAVDATGSGEEALDWVEAAPYEAIVLDGMCRGSTASRSAGGCAGNGSSPRS